MRWNRGLVGALTGALLLWGLLACSPRPEPAPGATAPETPPQVQQPTGSVPDTEQHTEDVAPPAESTRRDPAAAPEPPPAPTPSQTARPEAEPTALEGRITALRGTVSVHRDGTVLSRELDLGEPLREYDLLVTGADGYLTAEFQGPGLRRATLSLRPNTRVYVEQSLLESGGRQTTAQLLAGSVSLKVQRLSGGQFQVNTQSAALGVRGTTFDVIIGPQLEALVTCSEGRVEARVAGDRAAAIPGKALTVHPEDGIAEYNVQVQNIPRFQTRWLEEVVKEFQEIAVPVTRTVHRRWNRLLPRFRDAWGQLQAQSATLARWRQAVASGTELGTVELLRDRRALAPVLLNLKKTLFFLERDWAWLAAVQRDFPTAALDQDVGGKTARQFFQETDAIHRELGLQFSMAREAFRLYAAMVPDSPLGDFFED